MGFKLCCYAFKSGGVDAKIDAALGGHCRSTGAAAVFGAFVATQRLGVEFEGFAHEFGDSE